MRTDSSRQPWFVHQQRLGTKRLRVAARTENNPTALRNVERNTPIIVLGGTYCALKGDRFLRDCPYRKFSDCLMKTTTAKVEAHTEIGYVMKRERCGYDAKHRTRFSSTDPLNDMVNVEDEVASPAARIRIRRAKVKPVDEVVVPRWVV